MNSALPIRHFLLGFALLLSLPTSKGQGLTCVDSSLLHPAALCGAIFDPVCGCDGQTYGNGCQALNWGGLTAWTKGACDQLACPELKVNFDWTPMANDSFAIAFSDFSVMLGGVITSWAWDFGDGSSSTEQHPGHQYQLPGPWVVCLTVQAVTANGQQCEKTFCRVLQLGGGCVDACLFHIDLTLHGVELSAHLSPGPILPPEPAWVEWSLDDGQVKSNQHDFTYLFPGPGRHVLCANYPRPNGGLCTVCQGIEVHGICVDTARIDSTVACPQIFRPVCGCDGKTYGNSCEAIHYGGVQAWRPGACGSVCNDLYFDFMGFNSGGSFTVWTFNPTVIFPAADSLSFFWDFGNGQTSTDQSPTLNFLDTGLYRVCLTVEAFTAGGIACSDTRCHDFHLTLPPVLCNDPSVIDSLAACPAIIMPVCGCDGVTYENECEAYYHHGITSWTPGACPGDCSNFMWTFPPVPCLGVPDPVCGCDGITYDNACEALYQHGITRWTKGACCEQPQCQALFSLEVLPDLTVRLSDFSLNAESWSLDFGDGTTHGGYFDSLLHTYAVPGLYTICLNISNFAGSCSQTYCQTVDFPTSAPVPAIARPELLVFPNPARDKAMVRLKGSGNALRRIRMVDVLGKTVLEKTASGIEAEVLWYGLPGGTYFLQVETSRGWMVSRLSVMGE